MYSKLNRLYSLITLLTLIGLMRCTVPTSDDFKAPKWSVELIGPAAKAGLTIDDMVTARGLALEINLRADSLDARLKGNFPGGFPPIPLGTVGPRYTKGLQESIRAATFANCRLNLKIVNGFPLPISPGAKMFIRDKDNNLLVEHTLNRQINGDGDVYEVVFPLTNVRVTSQLSLVVENLATPGLNRAFSISDQRLQMFLTVDKIKMSHIELASDSYFEIIDTTTYNLSGKELNTNFLNGNIIAVLGNEMPVTYTVQSYFMDGSYKVIDSLFYGSPFSIRNAITDQRGNVLQMTNSRDTIPVNPSRYSLISKAKYLRTKASVKAIYIPTGEDVLLKNSQYLNLKLVGDLKTSITGD